MRTTLVQQVIDGRFVPFVAVEQFFAATPWFELLGVALSSLIHMYEFMVYYATFDSSVLFYFDCNVEWSNYVLG
jgi:hypothetical protein